MRSKDLGILCGVAILSLVLGSAAAQDAPPKKESPAAPTLGLQTGPAPVAAHWSKNKYPEAIPEGAPYYLVVRGDTLWDLAKRFLGSPYLWPQIWDQNKYITDAHWIYPGDPVVFPKVALVTEKAGEPGGLGPEERAAAEEAAAAGLPPEAAGAPTAGSVLYPAADEEAIRCAHYIVRDDEDENFLIIGSEDGSTKISITLRDIVYLSRGSSSGVKAGDVYTTHHVAYSLKHPVSGKRLGNKIETTGVVRVILTQENSSTAVVEYACADIHGGDYAKPMEGVNVPLLLRRSPTDRLTPPTGKAHGYVVDLADNAMVAGLGQIVSIDLGSDDGVAPGSVFSIYRIVYPSVPTSRNVLGELAVIGVREKTATAKIIYSRDHIMVGDEVELR